MFSLCVILEQFVSSQTTGSFPNSAAQWWNTRGLSCSTLKHPFPVIKLRNRSSFTIAKKKNPERR